MSLPSFTEADVLRWYGARDLIKAKTYVRSVTRLRAEPPVLSAFVLGSAPRPYQVNIRFSTNHAGNVLISRIASTRRRPCWPGCSKTNSLRKSTPKC